jgi:hypothetical protein
MFGYTNNFRTTTKINNQISDLDIVINSYETSDHLDFSTEITLLSLHSHRLDLQNELNNAIKAEKIIQIIDDAKKLKDNGDFQLAKEKYNNAFNITKIEFTENHPLFAEILFFKTNIDQLLGLYDNVSINLLKLKEYNKNFNNQNEKLSTLLDYHLASNYILQKNLMKL